MVRKKEKRNCQASHFKIRNDVLGVFPVASSPCYLKEVLEQLLEAVVVATNPSGHLISELFQKLPSKVQYPDYYAIIKKPIDPKTIVQRIQNGSYKSIHAMAKDIDLLAKNTKTYNEPGSQVFKVLLLKRYMELPSSFMTLTLRNF